MSNTCQATTKSGNPCKNNARENSDYCGTHKTFAVAETVTKAKKTAAKATKTTAKKAKATKEAIKETVAEHVPVEETIVEESQDVFGKLVNDLNGIVEEIKGNGNGLVNQLKETADKLPKPASVRESKLISELEGKVKGKSAQEILDRDNLVDVWGVLYENLQTSTENLRDTITEGINHSVETAREMDTVNQFRERVAIGSPQDLLSSAKWSEFAEFANETLQGQASSFRKWARTTRESAEDMAENAADKVADTVSEVVEKA